MARPENVLTDDLWRILEPLLPREKPLGTPGRPMVPNRRVVLGMLYVLLNGCPWNALPEQYGSATTCWRRLRDWLRRGVWKKVWKAMLEKAGPDMRLALMDSSPVPAPKEGGLRAQTLLTGARRARRGT